MGLGDHLGRVLDPAQQQRADHTVRLAVGDVERLTGHRPDLDVDLVFGSVLSETVVHHRIRFDRDHVHARCVVPHVDTGPGSEFDDRARHRSDLGRLSRALRCMRRLGRPVEQERLETAA